ncbi:MAG: cytochrome c oxidase accessory protein CcoG, partial [Gammaproteobacteria bacterium]|nr:cytochrome c oxidase accessory protein CcoG [Gammaproteobacteria bacterium]
LWCGYACPQTVWTEAFLAVERFVEGDRRNQIKLDASPWNLQKLRKKALKHILWLVLAAWTGFTFVGYFTPVTDLASRVPAFELGPWETFWVLFYAFATWGNAGFMREQVCKYMCPYARFQSAMFDKDTLIITYDEKRGEARGSRRRSEDYRVRGLGDCIDCSICVQVCPTGIDIRDGLQYQCIACSACVDACDTVMEKIGYPKGLIRYDTQHGLEGKPTRLLRPRVIVYAALLASLIAMFIYSVAGRVPLGLDVIRDRNALYRETDEGLIENVYLLKILNMSEADQTYTLHVRGIEGADLVLDRDELRVAGGAVLELPVSVRADEAQLHARSMRIEFLLSASGEVSLAVAEEARFLGPAR